MAMIVLLRACLAVKLVDMDISAAHARMVTLIVQTILNAIAEKNIVHYMKKINAQNAQKQNGIHISVDVASAAIAAKTTPVSAIRRVSSVALINMGTSVNIDVVRTAAKEFVTEMVHASHVLITDMDHYVAAIVLLQYMGVLNVIPKTPILLCVLAVNQGGTWKTIGAFSVIIVGLSHGRNQNVTLRLGHVLQDVKRDSMEISAILCVMLLTVFCVLRTRMCARRAKTVFILKRILFALNALHIVN